MQTTKRKIIAIVGPTASGKTSIGVKLAKEFDGEIISADSRQVYRGLDLGTGKDLAEYGEVKYHMIDIVDPEEKMTLFDYLPLARAAIEDIFARGKVPIIVGGTGLYIQGIVEGFFLEPISKFPISNFQSNSNSKSQINKYAREQLDNLTIEQLNNILREIHLEKFEIIDHKNRHRLIRAIELAQEGLEAIKIKPDFEVLQIGVDVPRKCLHKRIDRRVDERFEQGMDQEVVDLLKSGVNPAWLIGLGLEYREITQFVISNFQFSISNQCSSSNDQNEIKINNPEFNKNLELKIKNCSEFAEMKQNLKWKIHQFARRQMTWFNRFPDIQWLSKYDEIKRFAKIFLEH